MKRYTDSIVRLAAGLGHSSILRFLLDSFPDLIHWKSPDDGKSLLHCTALSHRDEASKVLLEHGADPSAVDEMGRRRFSLQGSDLPDVAGEGAKVYLDDDCC